MEAAFVADDALFLRAGGSHAELFPLEIPVWNIFRLRSLLPCSRGTFPKSVAEKMRPEG